MLRFISPGRGGRIFFLCAPGAVMRPSVLWGAGILFLALACVRLALPPDAAAASSGKIIYSFAGGADGAYPDPEPDLIMDAAGNFYGTTNEGGIVGVGTVLELTRTKGGRKHQVLYSFAGSPNDGAYPKAGLVFDIAGNLYGTTAHGGGGSSGTVFKLSPNAHEGWAESLLHSFTGSSDGANPNTDLVFDSEGNLYGTTYASGGVASCNFGCGTVFKVTPNAGGTWKESTIYAFAGSPRVTFPPQPSRGILAIPTGYAYETEPNKPIITGKTKGPDVITLDPATLGTLGCRRVSDSGLARREK